MLILRVLVYLRGSQTAVFDVTTWICIHFKRDISLSLKSFEYDDN